MIKNVKVTNYLGLSITLELGAPEKSGFLVREISGLGPAKAVINMSDLSNDDGSVYNSARAYSRNIVMDLKFLEFPTIEDTRHKSYKYFPLKKKIKLTFTTDNRVCEVYGYVESNEPNIFSKAEATQVSIVCPSPYFNSLSDYLTIFYGVEDLFEFPFSNESLTENLIEFGNIQNKTENVVHYTGDAKVGILITMRATGPADNVTIYNLGTRESMTLNTVRIATLTGDGIIAGDEIYISTVKGDKYVILFRDGEFINILNAIDRYADWFQLSKGDNIFAYTADYGITNLQFKITNKILYEGI